MKIGMIRSDDAVGGFFEDLPVLAFVLLGTFVLVSTSVFTSSEMSEARELQRLEVLAGDIIKTMIMHMTGADRLVYTVTVAALRDMSLASLVDRFADDLQGYCVSVVALYPCNEWLTSAARGDSSSAVSTGFARTFLNATFDDGLIGVIEVTALVW